MLFIEADGLSVVSQGIIGNTKIGEGCAFYSSITNLPRDRQVEIVVFNRAVRIPPEIMCDSQISQVNRLGYPDFKRAGGLDGTFQPTNLLYWMLTNMGDRGSITGVSIATPRCFFILLH